MFKILKRWGAEISEPFSGKYKKFWTKKSAVRWLKTRKHDPLIILILIDKFKSKRYRLKDTLTKALWTHDYQNGTTVFPGKDVATDSHLLK
jgi:hypothetical protein